MQHTNKVLFIRHALGLPGDTHCVAVGAFSCDDGCANLSFEQLAMQYNIMNFLFSFLQASAIAASHFDFPTPVDRLV